MRVGFIYNMATEELLRERPETTLSDCDSIETIRALTQALEAAGHSVIGLNADPTLPARLVTDKFDIAFNIATGTYGDTPQAHVPAMLDYLQIPHTGPSVLTEAVCEHKPWAKTILMAAGLPTPSFQLFERGDEPIKPGLRFPLIVKLPSEGGSLGLTYDSVVSDESALRQQIARLIDSYQEGALVETYLSGREFTVSVLGNDPPYALPIAELLFFGKTPIRLDEPDVSMFEDLKRVSGQPDLSYVPMESRSVAPADVTSDLADQIERLAIGAYRAVGCRDWARIDMRMNDVGELFILEVNLEPGISPDYVLPKAAYAAGWSFDELVQRILNHAIERYPHLRP